MADAAQLQLSPASLRSKDVIPGRLTADSVPLGWRGVLARAYRDPVETEGFATPEHADLLLVLMTQGSFPIECGHKGHWQPLVTRPGNLWLTAPGMSSKLRYRRVLGDEPRTLHLYLGLPMLEMLADDLSLPAPSSGLPDALKVEDPYLQAGAWALRDALHRGAPALYSEAIAHGMASYLLLNSASLQAGRNPTRPRTVALSAPQVARVHAYMLDHLDAEVTLDDLAVVAHTSKFHFARSFKAATGLTPLRYLTDLRMVLAADLLRTTSLPVAEIAARAGYRTTNGFGSAFRRHHGRTPSALRSSGGLSA